MEDVGIFFAKIKAEIWSVQRRQHTLCTLTSCGIDVMPSFSWFQICPLTAIDKWGILACADIWRGAALQQWKPRCKLLLSLTTWVAVCANYSIIFCQNFRTFLKAMSRPFWRLFLSLIPHGSQRAQMLNSPPIVYMSRGLLFIHLQNILSQSFSRNSANLVTQGSVLWGPRKSFCPWIHVDCFQNWSLLSSIYPLGIPSQ